MLGRLVNESLKQRNASYPWGDTLSLFSNTDLGICNLECAISNRGEPWTVTPKEFHFRSDPKNVRVLSEAGINLVSLAHNHVLDFGIDALEDTLKVLDKSSIKHAGAGLGFAEAKRPAVLNIFGERVGMIAFTDNQPEWESSKHRPGIFYVPIDLNDVRTKKLLDLIEITKREVDLLVVSAHWGPNWGYEPPAEHVPFAHAMMDAGADIVFGHSGHVFRGIEIYNQRLILYCAGNFIDDYAVDRIERNDQSCVYVVDIPHGKINRLSIYPTMTENFRARFARDYERLEITDKMKELSAKYGTGFKSNATLACLELRVRH